MAVKSFMKSSGLVALAAGLAAMVVPMSASAQERGMWRGRGGDASAAQQQQQQQQSDAGNWQGRRNGEARGNGGNWQGRGDGGWRRSEGGWRPGRPQAEPAPQLQVAPQAGAPQMQRRWNGGDGSSWRQRQAQQQAQGTWNGDRSTWRQGSQPQTRAWQGRMGTWSGQQRTWDGNRTWDGQNRRWDGNRTWDGQNRRWDGNRTWDGQNRWRDGNRRYSGNYSRWNNNWRRDNRYNWYSYRNTHRNVFRLGRYYSPYSNWSYRRLGIGFFLQPLFYSQNNWIDDPWMYRLPEAYGPYRWVRYYDDAILVDIYSGEVVDVIHDFFW